MEGCNKWVLHKVFSGGITLWVCVCVVVCVLISYDQFLSIYILHTFSAH